MNRYRPIYTCPNCGMRWKGSAVRAGEGRSPEEDAEYRLAMNGTPKCPNLDCGTINIARGIDLSIPKAPAQVGQNTAIKAVDKTAEMVMQDYGMTDLRTDVREGETAAPKLAPRLQQQADNFFSGRGARRHPQLPTRMSPAMMGRAAIAGAYRQPNGYQPVENLHTAEPSLRDTISPPIKILNQPRRRR